MSEIKKYQKAMNFKANPRYLRRDFIVPLYTGTEPDIVPETSVEELGAVQEFNDGGRVGFQKAGRVFGELPQDVKQYKGDRLNIFEEGLNDLIKWKKNPTVSIPVLPQFSLSLFLSIYRCFLSLSLCLV